MSLQFIYQIRCEHYSKTSEYLFINLFKKKKKLVQGMLIKGRETLPRFLFQNFTRFCASHFSLLRAYYNISLTAVTLHKTIALGNIGVSLQRQRLALLGNHWNRDLGSKVVCCERAFEDADGLNTLSHNLPSLIKLNPTAVVRKMDIFVKFV